MTADGKRREWTLLTGHGHILIEIARAPQSTMRELAAAAGLTERAAQMIVADLEEAGYVTRSRVGRRNQYAIHADQGFRHRAQDGLHVAVLLDALAATPPQPTDTPGGER